MDKIVVTIAQELGVKNSQVENTIKLIDEGNTIPFIARYRKEVTGGLSDETLRDLGERLTYLRNLEDNRIDISLLGAVYPFRVFSPKEKRVLNTVENINLRLRTYTGGYQRFEYDHYRGGAPWPIANLWMTLYYLENGEKKKAKESFDFVLKTAGKHSFLGEQIDNNTLKPNWVIGLGWSHAMFIIVLEKMMNM